MFSWSYHRVNSWQREVLGLLKKQQKQIDEQQKQIADMSKKIEYIAMRVA